MTRVRMTILLMFSLCSALSLLWGLVLERNAHGTIADFKVVYYGTRCLIEHHDPYNENQMMRVYLANGGTPPSNQIEQSKIRQVITLQVYLPTAFVYIAPFAVLPWPSAHLLWAALTAIVFTVAAFLIWTLTQDHAPGASFYLLCFVLTNSGILFAGGNPAGASVALCLIATWCFLKEKHVRMGVICFAASLALKPHDTGLVWLYFMLAGGIYRKRALETLAFTTALAVPGILWISFISPRWIHELLYNLAADSVRGGVVDPGPHSMGGSGGGMMINLQTVISVFRDDPHFYNPITYLICGFLLLIWIIFTVRAHPGSPRDYLALATVATLSMLPLYHRPYDAKILILTLPAFAMLLVEKGVTGRLALLLSSFAIILTSDFPLAILAQANKGLNFANDNFMEQCRMILRSRPVPVILLILGVFYLVVYARRCLRERVLAKATHEPALIVTDQ